MLLPVLQSLFQRDLLKLREEIELYKNEAALWKIEKSIANSAGNLCLHLIGNLNTFIGAEFGKTGYIRNRELEFSQKNIPRAELVHKINSTIKVVESALNNLDEAALLDDYPQPVQGKNLSTGFFMAHLATHLTYHLGQINYHRRLLDE
jgi:uncharacterized damage-inducible protein DinB